MQRGALNCWGRGPAGVKKRSLGTGAELAFGRVSRRCCTWASLGRRQAGPSQDLLMPKVAFHLLPSPSPLCDSQCPLLIPAERQ